MLIKIKGQEEYINSDSIQSVCRVGKDVVGVFEEDKEIVGFFKAETEEEAHNELLRLVDKWDSDTKKFLFKGDMEKWQTD